MKPSPEASGPSSQIHRQYNNVLHALDKEADTYHNIANQIWHWAELGYHEYQSSALLQKTLREAGFEVTSPVAGIPTAFVARYGTGKPTIGFLAEFDALPGSSQEAVPYRKALSEKGNGHACGHHLFGTGSIAAAIAVSRWIKQNGADGCVTVYGTPAEEGGSGKVYMARNGLFDDADIVLHWHPNAYNAVQTQSTLAVISAKFRFFGEPSHAAKSPERGRSALDAIEAMNFMVNLMREHVPQEARMHYIITKGGDAPNIVPAFAESYHYVRHPEAQVAKSIFDRTVQTAKAAAMGTDTRMEYEIIGGTYPLLVNETLAGIMQANLERVGGVTYTSEEKQFATEIAKTLPAGTLPGFGDAETVAPLRLAGNLNMISTDVGDVSWLVPTVGLDAATWVPGTALHSWQATAAGGISIGTKGMIVAAKTMALTALSLIENPDMINRAQDEFDHKRGRNFTYTPLVGDREPPLDYTA